jgi:2-dehydro-3-deoxyphosphooctonate aldolase (KDO 8-P synthase)
MTGKKELLMNNVTIAGKIKIGAGNPLVLIGGPCVIESEAIIRETVSGLKEITSRLGIPFIFKASFDKANRTSLSSYRGPGLRDGLELLGRIKEEFGVPVISDIHEASQAAEAAKVLDVIQIPAFLCRQTDLLVAAAQTGKPLSIKKGQFLSPWDMKNAVNKVRESGNDQIMLTERGIMYGYNNLVVDMRALPVMRGLGCPVIYDATHSVQLPGGAGGSSGGQREFIPPLSRAAVAAGIDGLFMEIHPDPAKALCDGPNSMPLAEVEELLQKLVQIHEVVNG